MIYNLLETVKDYEGKEIMNGEGESAIPTTWKDVILGVVNRVDQATTEDEKANIYEVSIKAVNNPSSVEYEASEVALILRQIRKNSFPVIIGKADEFFNQKN